MLFHALFSVVTASLGAAGYAHMITMAVNSTVQYKTMHPFTNTIYSIITVWVNSIPWGSQKFL